MAPASFQALAACWPPCRLQQGFHLKRSWDWDRVSGNTAPLEVLPYMAQQELSNVARHLRNQKLTLDQRKELFEQSRYWAGLLAAYRSGSGEASQGSLLKPRKFLGYRIVKLCQKHANQGIQECPSQPEAKGSSEGVVHRMHAQHGKPGELKSCKQPQQWQQRSQPDRMCARQGILSSRDARDTQGGSCCTAKILHCSQQESHGRNAGIR